MRRYRKFPDFEIEGAGRPDWRPASARIRVPGSSAWHPIAYGASLASHGDHSCNILARIMLELGIESNYTCRGRTHLSQRIIFYLPRRTQGRGGIWSLDVPATIPVITTEVEMKANRRNRRRWLPGLGNLLLS